MEAFDFQQWFRRRFSQHTPADEPRRPGTFTLSEEQLLTDLVYDFQSRQGLEGSDKKAVSLCKNAIKNAGCLALDTRGYSLRRERRIRFDDMWRIVVDD